MKFIINDLYKQDSDFIKRIPEIFSYEGETIFQFRNTLKRFGYKERAWIVKSFKVPHLINRFVYATFRQSKARRSYENGLKLIAAGFYTPTPVACIEQIDFGLSHSFYISEELTGVHEIRELQDQPMTPERIDVLKAFGTFSAALHTARIYHKDYTPGNILYKRTDVGYRFYLVDINRMSIGKYIPEKKSYWNFRRLCLSHEGFIVFTQTFAEIMGYNKDYAVKEVLFHARKNKKF
ncbi:MAG: lipopolysaccharide kinase InaA family protein [Bacteroides sp.]|nr:lipopolysaccharide kinase InaA family protein [Bacteroides sp.]